MSCGAAKFLSHKRSSSSLQILCDLCDLCGKIVLVNTFIGNQAALKGLRAAIRSGKVPHAYLFTGPPQVGKSTLALWLAQTLLCEQSPPGEPAPCGNCRECARIAHAAHPDVQTYSLARQAQTSDRASASRELGIDAVRELVGEIDLLPFQAERKVYIIQDAGALTDEAANALLKTLEEPPAYATLVLIATDERSLPETVRSRCTPVRLHAVSRAAIREMLRSRPDVTPEMAERVADLSAGRPGWALEAVKNPRLLQEHDAHISALLEALGGGAASRLALAERMSKRWTAGHREEVYATLFNWLGFWRETMLRASGDPSSAARAPYADTVQRLAQAGVGQAGKAASRTLEAISHLDANVNTRMAVENLLLDLP